MRCRVVTWALPVEDIDALFCGVDDPGKSQLYRFFFFFLDSRHAKVQLLQSKKESSTA
jgi:hypothetical protein